MTPQEFADKYLTPPVRLRYIYNLKNYRRLTLESKLKGSDELEVLNFAFLWESTPEGHYYWERIEDNIVYGKMRDDLDRIKRDRIIDATPHPVVAPE